MSDKKRDGTQTDLTYKYDLGTIRFEVIEPKNETKDTKWIEIRWVQA